MSYHAALDKAVAKLAVAKVLGPKYAAEVLEQARFHINLALDDARRQQNRKPEPDRPAAQP